MSERAARRPARPGSAARHLRALAASLLVIGGSPAWAIDLLESYRLALQNDRQYRIVQARTKAEEEAVPQAWSQLLPNIGASITRNRTETERTQSGKTSTVPRSPAETDAVQLRQPILRLRSAFALQQAREEVKSAQADLQREKQSVGVRVAAAYFETLLSRDRLSLLAAQRRNIEARLLGAQKALEAGTGVRTDIDEARAQLDKLRAQEIGLLQNIRVTTAQLEVLIGQGVDTVAPIDVSRMTPEVFDPGEIDPLLELAMEKSPDIMARAAELEASKSAIRAAKADHLPTLDFIASYNRSFGENRFFTGSNALSPFEITSNSYGLQLTIPIYSGGLTQSRVREAVAQSEERKERYFYTVNSAQLELRKNFMAIKEGIAQFRAFQQALASAEQAVLSNQKGVLAGTRTSLDVLLVEQQRFQVELEFAQARYGMLAAWVRLNSLIGTMDDEEFTRLNDLLTTAPVPAVAAGHP
ncbi:MAG: TolC family outer membrane protein [Rhodocyclaceae bacterium]|nr:TolC family outer membrane protein [Rhodocyclaceae bacterium]